MTDEPLPPGDEGKGPSADGPPSPQLRARVPDHVAGGHFSTGAIVITGPNEFVLDFLQTVGRPHRVAARVVMPHVVMPQFIQALRTNLDLYQGRFGAIRAAAQAEGEGKRPTPQEIYDDLKMPDEVLSGVYANGVMIGHGPNEFGLDFLTSFFPQSAVSARVFLAAGQVPRLLESLENAAQQLQQRRDAAADENAPPPPPLDHDDDFPSDGPDEYPGGGPDTGPGGSDPEGGEGGTWG